MVTHEASLRAWNKFSSFSEEINRVFTSHVADLHFAPTHWAKENLLKEGVPENQVFVTGNTVIDVLHIGVAKVRKNPPPIPGLPRRLPNICYKRMLNGNSLRRLTER